MFVLSCLLNTKLHLSSTKVVNMSDDGEKKAHSPTVEDGDAATKEMGHDEDHVNLNSNLSARYPASDVLCGIQHS